MMRVKKQLLSWPILIIYFIFLIGVFFVVKNAFAQVSSCPGLASTQPSPDGNYKATAFGIVDEWADPGDAPYAPAYGNPPEYCSAEMSGPECEKKIRWFAANGDIFGKWKKLLVTRPDTGRSVVVLTIDRGPACNQELAKGPLIDLSYAAAVIYLGNGEGGNYETVSVKPVADDTPLGPTDGLGITTLPNVGNGTTSGGGSGSYTLTLKVRLKPGTKDTYLINRATAQALGGGSAALLNNAPAGQPDAQCTPNKPPPPNPEDELKKLNISTSGFSNDGLINIYNVITCVSGSNFPKLINSQVTIYNDRRSDGAIGMNCDDDNKTCGVWVPEKTNSFKFILTHEFGHIFRHTNPREITHMSDFANAHAVEGGLSPYSGPYYGGQGGCEVQEGLSEDYAEMVAYYLNPTMGGKTGACDSRDNPKNSLFEDSHFPLHLNVAKQVL